MTRSNRSERAWAARRALGVVLLGVAARLPADELVLPAPASGARTGASSFRVEAIPRPDGAFDAVVTITLKGPSDQGERLALTLAGPAVQSVELDGRPLPPPGAPPLEIDVAAASSPVLRLMLRLEPDELDWVPAADAGWAGRTRGPLLQPARRLVIRHAPESAFADAPVSARIAPGGELPVSALFQSPPGRLAQGEASWEGKIIRPPERLALTWPLLPEAYVPRDRAEAEALADDLLQRDVETIEYDRVGEAARSSGEPAAAAASSVLASLASERVRQREAAERDQRRRAEEEARRAAARQAEEREKEREEAARQAKLEREAREQAERAEAQAREAQSKADREARRAREQADRESAAAAAREQADREAAAAAAKEQADREAAAAAAKEQADREAAAAAAKEQADREAAAAAAKEQADREAAARTANEQADREAAVRTANEQADREAAVRTANEQADREPAARTRPAETQPVVSPPGESTKPVDEAELAERRERLAKAADELRERDAREALARSIAAAQPATVPWIRSADSARLFLAVEAAGGLRRARIEEAVAVIRARRGEPFRYERRWRERFASEPWYAPRREDALLPATEGEIAALEVLAQALH